MTQFCVWMVEEPMDSKLHRMASLRTLRSTVLRFLYHDTPLNSIDWASLKFGSILQFLNLQSETCSKQLSQDLTALLTAWWWILRLAWVSCMPPLSLRYAEAVTYCILKECRYCIFEPKFPGKATGFFLWKQQDWDYLVSCEQECDLCPTAFAYHLLLVITSLN
jgi:hypothetical protein